MNETMNMNTEVIGMPMQPPMAVQQAPARRSSIGRGAYIGMGFGLGAVTLTVGGLLIHGAKKLLTKRKAQQELVAAQQAAVAQQAAPNQPQAPVQQAVQA